MALERPTHAHVQIIQALSLLAQTFAGMAQATGHAFQAQTITHQTVAHAHHQAPMQAFDLTDQMTGIGRE
ncbi:hypothetical protein D3C78_1819330 [compost metagenome]